MKDIYLLSRQVIVYLGDGRNHRPKRGVPREPDVHKIRFFGDDQDETHLASFRQSMARGDGPSSFHVFCLLRLLGDVTSLEELTAALQDVPAGQFRDLIEEMRLMLLSPWWQRIWVVQEMTVPRWAVVRYGPLEAPWELFVAAAVSPAIQEASVAAAAAAAATDRPGPPPAAHLTIPADCLKVLCHFARFVQNSEQLRHRWRCADPSSSAPGDAQLHLGGGGGDGADLLTLLQDFSARQASDERDKVFALLGLAAPDQRALVRPTYGRSVAAVYRATCVALLRHAGRLSPWTGDLARKSQSPAAAAAALPSWVPDWSAVFEEADRRRARAYHPGGGGGASVSYQACGNWGFEVVGSREEYWAFTERNMRLLRDDFERSKGTKALPARLGLALAFYGQCVSHHRSAHIRAVNGLERVLKTYETMRSEYPSAPGKEMKTFHDLHLGLLDVPTDLRVTKEILHFCHQRLWPEEGFCSSVETGCIGHGWDESRPRRVRLETGADDFAVLRRLVERATAQFREYKALAAQYLLGCGDHAMYEVGRLCVDLQKYCVLADDKEKPEIWAKRLFSRSAVVYGEMDLGRSLVAFRCPADRERDPSSAAGDVSSAAATATPFWFNSGFPVLPSLRHSAPTTDLLCRDYLDATRRGGPPPASPNEPLPSRAAAESELAALGVPTALLSIESVPQGKVQRLLGTRLMTWADASLSYATLRAWCRAWQAAAAAGSEAQTGPRPPRDAVALARTLVGDTVPVADHGEPDSRRLGRRVRRLSRADYGDLMAWFDGPLRERMAIPEAETEGREGSEGSGVVDDGEKAAPAGPKPRTVRTFDEALVLATEGRVMFALADGRLGLGPASMAPDDEVRVLPGGSTWLVLRRREGLVEGEEGGSFAVVGDCYLDAPEEGVEEAGSAEESWPGGLPEEVFAKEVERNAHGFKHPLPDRKRIWLF